jgi:hypothetical protein
MQACMHARVNVCTVVGWISSWLYNRLHHHGVARNCLCASLLICSTHTYVHANVVRRVICHSWYEHTLCTRITTCVVSRAHGMYMSSVFPIARRVRDRESDACMWGSLNVMLYICPCICLSCKIGDIHGEVAYSMWVWDQHWVQVEGNEPRVG